MSLTKEQEQVRDIHGKNMLVSAAAGSGKTFVLVERIIKEILDEKSGFDVDRILVVTFTIAAANEMKERIRKAIDEKAQQPDANERIRSQATLIHNAHIRTIDSFCNWVVKNYFYEIDREPSFRYGTSGELKMMADEVFENLLRERLAGDEPEFKTLADSYIVQNRTGDLKGIVQTLHEKAVSFAWPNEWYDNSLRIYDINSALELENADFIKEIMSMTDTIIQHYISKADKLLSISETDFSAISDEKKLPTLYKEIRLLQGIIDAKSFHEKYLIINQFEFPKYSATNLGLEDYEKDLAKSIRDDYKEEIQKLKSKYFNLDIEELFDALKYVERQATTLINFTREYTNRLYEEKCKKSIFDFNDIEHMALEILREKDSKEHEKRPVAVELSQHFKEVMVDEYQDSNELQEQILTAISDGTNYFTVGDVKQSIYSFRQATPQLFIDKLYSYPISSDDVDGKDIRIDLDNNFRSRGEVLNFCNQVFSPMMQEDIGGVRYDEKAALKVGDTTFVGDTNDYQPEILIAEQIKDAMKELGIENKDYLQGLVAAKKIKEMLADDFQVSEKKDGKRALRPMKFSDVVILLSALKGHGQHYVDALRDSGVPAYLSEETGFFEREEIETVLSMLNVIDNPFNDIPLAAVLHSPMFNFTSERLAQIRATDVESNLYSCLRKYAESEDNEDIDCFLDTLNYFRDMAIDTPIHELIEAILEKTGYGTYVSALELGQMASANLNKLVDEAISFENTSFKGLSKFVAYIEGLRTYEEDLGLAKTVGENDNAVRIMTIHKSKGLEFPVVFVGSCEAGLREDKNNFAFDQDYGFSLEYKNPQTRASFKPCFYNYIKEKAADRELGEFYRKYYVALTRPVDKLIITAAIQSTEKKPIAVTLEEYKADGTLIDYFTRKNSKSAIEIFIRALDASNSSVKPQIISCNDLFTDQVTQSINKELVRRQLVDILEEENQEESNIVNTISFQYADAEDSNYKSKYSVSEIKHQAMEEAFQFNDDATPVFIHQEEESYIPLFMRGKEMTEESNVPAGALYGTAMHRFLECFDFAREDYLESFKEQLDFIIQTRSMSDDELARISVKKLKSFMEDDIASRMSQAALNGKLYKEKPFVFGSDANKLFDDTNASDELILVQGIIDVFFEENDGIVLLDYKTDRVDEDSQLVLRYEKQLQLYKSAIEKAYNVPVKDVYLYSFALEKTIRLENVIIDD